MTNDDNPFVPNLRDTAEAEQFLFDLPGVRHVNIFGINALGLVHGHQGELMAILRRSGSVDVFLHELGGGLSELLRRFGLRLYDHRPEMAMKSVESEGASYSTATDHPCSR